jgi:hypothetical protein
MKAATILLALFVVLTMAFASISAFEYFNYGTAVATTTTITTTITAQLGTGQTYIHFKSSSNPLQKNGNITIGGTDLFVYTSLQSPGVEPTPNTILENVTFTYLKPNATITGCISYEFKVTFQGGSSENLMAQSCPTNFETTLVLSNHQTPTAGLLLMPSVGIYALVSI